MSILSVDAEELVKAFLLGRTDVQDVVGDRIYSDGLPAHPFWPSVVITRLGGTVRYPSWLDYPRLQIDIWANDQQTARQAARVLRAAIDDLPGTHSLGVVTNVDEVGGLQWLPDTAYKGGSGRPRYLFTVVATVHPVS